MLQPNNSAIGQVFRFQVIDALEVLGVVNTPKLASLPPSFDRSELTLLFCGPGADSNNHHNNMTWKANYTFKVTDLLTSLEVSRYQQVNISGVVWVGSTLLEVTDGINVVEAYHC